MDTQQWVKLKSWHALRGPKDHFGPTTRCGRDAEGKEVVDDLPGTEKTCESCLRHVARDREAAEE
jgi:hypothetical protein